MAEMTPEEWNSRHPVGTPVWFWPGGRMGGGRTSVTRSAAWNLGGPTGTPVVMVEDYAGGIALSHIEVRPVEVTPYVHGLIADARDAEATAIYNAIFEQYVRPVDPDLEGYGADELVGVLLAVVKGRTDTATRKAVAEDIRRELVCCHVYDQGTAAEVAEARRTGHDLCYWGEASARIAEDRDDADSVS